MRFWPPALAPLRINGPLGVDIVKKLLWLAALDVFRWLRAAAHDQGFVSLLKRRDGDSTTIAVVFFPRPGFDRDGRAKRSRMVG